MDPKILLFIIFLVLLLLRVPIGIALGASAIFIIWNQSLGMSVLAPNFFSGIAKFPLLAIPFFILAGVIMEKADIARRIIHLAKLIVGPINGGLAIVAVVTAMFWGAVSGSGPATTAALGTILIPGMVAAKYHREFAASVVSISSGLAIVIPPSIAFIVYGVITNTSVPALFAAGIMPGLVMGGFLIIAVFLISLKRGYKGERWGRLREIAVAFKDAFWGLMTPVVILGGIYGGIFTPTEAAAIAIFYGLFVGFVVYRTLTWSSFFKLMVDSVVISSVVMMVVTLAGIFSWVASAIGVIDATTHFILSLSKNPHVILILANIVILIAGMFLDAISIYYVFLPIFVPIMMHFGWDPIWFGVVMTVNLAIGQVTPPVAVNLYVGANISGSSLEDIAREAIPLIIAAVIALLVISFVPSLSLYLPKLWKLY